MNEHQFTAIKFMLDSGKSESDVFLAFNMTCDEWIRLKTGNSNIAQRLQLLTQPKQMPTSKELLAQQAKEKELLDKPTPPPKLAWSGWGSDPDLAARNIVREFEMAHGMEPGRDPDQTKHKGMGDTYSRDR